MMILPMIKFCMASMALLFVAQGVFATPLHVAAQQNDYRLVESMLDVGADVNAIDEYGDTPLHKAVQQHTIETAALLIARGAKVDVRNRFGATPLHYASANDANTAAAMLIAKGASVNALTSISHTPLHWAVKENSTEVVDLLVAKGADVDTVSGWLWFYGYSNKRENWRRGKEWFDNTAYVFSVTEEKRFRQKIKQRTAQIARGRKKAEATTTQENIIDDGAVKCAFSGTANGCFQATAISLVNWDKQIRKIKQWEDRQLELIENWKSASLDMKSGGSVHDVRFVVPPNDSSQTVNILEENPFTHYVARLVFGDNACSAFLVHPKIAMTNSHCVCSDARCNKRTPVDQFNLTFVREDLSGDHDIITGVSRIYYTDRSAGPQDDYAFLILDQFPNLGGHLDVAPDVTGLTTIATAGYPGDLYGGEVMTALWGCVLKEKTEILFFSERHCHNYKGASGSPYIAVDGPHRGKVIGVNSFSIGNLSDTGGGPSVSSFYTRFQQVIQQEEMRNF